MKKVTRKTFNAFLTGYPNRISQGWTTISEPPIANYLDLSLGKDFEEGSAEAFSAMEVARQIPPRQGEKGPTKYFIRRPKPPHTIIVTCIDHGCILLKVVKTSLDVEEYWKDISVAAFPQHADYLRSLPEDMRDAIRVVLENDGVEIRIDNIQDHLDSGVLHVE